MKKRLLRGILLLLLPGILAISVTASQVGDKEIDVIASFQTVSNTPASYSVDLQWTDMTFTYTQEDTHIWDPVSHSYKTTSKAGWDRTKGTVTVTNHSNVDVRVTVAYIPEPGMGVQGSLKNASGKLKAGTVGGYNNADHMTTTLTISGTPADAVTAAGTKVGSLKITIQ